MNSPGAQCLYTMSPDFDMLQFDTPFVAIQHSLLNGGLEHEWIIALIFPIILGISSSQLTFIFIRWVGIPPARRFFEK